MNRSTFWVLWDYGQGGQWALIRADSAEQIRVKYPRLHVFDAAPTTLDEETIARVSRAGIQDLESTPTGWLTDHLPPATHLISSPVEFERLLELVQRQLRIGTLKQRDSDIPGFPQVDVSQLQPGGPWPDIIEADFVDVRGHGYHLFVDCYHGTGGEWRVTNAA